MKNFLLLFLFLPLSLWAQLPQQTVKGTILDRDNKQPLVGATLYLPNTDFSAMTDEEGRFRIENVPVGRYQLRCELSGYESYQTDELIVSSAKELELNLLLQELAVTTGDIVVTANNSQNRPLNELSVVSTRSFSVEETQRYASSINDPSRMAMGFPGVRPSQDNNADIIVRGNSPIGVLWRLEGIDIPNPNHFARKGSSGGGITIFSASLLSNSDFSTGAFAAEYGNAFSSVFDMRFRKGNNEKREYTLRMGLIGLDVATEGPFQKGKGSYLVNYRYSTLGLLNRFGIYLVGENINNTFQDLSFNLSFPIKNKGTLTVFGLGGLSSELTTPLDSSRWELPTDKIKNDFITKTGVLGATYTQLLDEKSYLKIATAVMGSQVLWQDDTLALGSGRPFRINDENYTDARFSINGIYNRKFNNQWLLKTGLYFNQLFFGVAQNRFNPATNNQDTVLDGSGQTQLLQGFGQFRYRPGQRWTILGGVHALFLTLNKTYSVEPRLAVRYTLAQGHSLGLAYGIHGRMLPLGSYFYRAADGSQPNRDLPFIKAQHLVLGYDWYSEKGIHIGLELYYQNLWNVPVSAVQDSSYWMLNDRDGYVQQLALEQGRGYNYGLDLTVEKFFARQFFFLFASSVYQSEYVGLNGRRNPTRYAGMFSNSLLLGKEFTFKKGGVLQLGGRLMYAGSLRYTPSDSAASLAAGMLVRDYTRPFEGQLRPYFRFDARIAYRKSFRRSYFTIAFDGQNLTSYTNFNPNREVFNPRTQEIYFLRQSSLVPVLSMQLDF